MRKRIVSSILAATMVIACLAGCGKSTSNTENNANTEINTNTESKVEESVSTESKTRVIVDHAGNEVEIPAEINRIVFTSITPLPSVYCLLEGSADKIVGMSPSSMSATKNSLLAQTITGIDDISTDFMTGGDINIEELIAMRPDVVFYRSENTDEYEKYKAAGIPAVAFSVSSWGSDSIATFEAWVTLLGEVLNKDDRAKGIVEYGREVYDLVQTRIEEAGESLEKPRVLFLYKYGDGTIQTSGKNHFGQYWADASGAINVAEENDAAALEVNMEQIYEWNPDKIFITNFVPYLTEDFTNNAIEDHDWSVVSAVQNEEVYKCPLGMYRWYAPSSDTPLMLLWLAKTNHPELFEDINLEEKIKEYYRNFYQVELTDEKIEMIFNPTREAAGA